MYTGLKIVRPGISNATLRCKPMFHGRIWYDTAQLIGISDDVLHVEYGLVHSFFSYTGDDGLRNLLQWGNQTFHGSNENVPARSHYMQFALLQRYRPNNEGKNLLPLMIFAAKALTLRRRWSL